MFELFGLNIWEQIIIVLACIGAWKVIFFFYREYYHLTLLKGLPKDVDTRKWEQSK